MKAILLLLLLPLSLFGTKYYISPTGSDGSGTGTTGSPWYTLTKAWTAVSAGDTIIVKTGTYNYTSRPEMVSKSGTAGSRIVVMGEPGQPMPVISRTTGDYGINIGILLRKCDYVTVRDLEITGFYQPSTTTNLISGLLADSSGFCHFYNLRIHDNGNGLRIQGNSPGNRIENCDFYRNSDPYSSSPYGNADGCQVAFLTSRASTDTTWITNCRSWWNSDDGYDFYSNDGVVIIDNCWSFWNGYKPGNFETAGNGNGLKLGPTSSLYTAKKRILRNVLAFQNRNDGIDINGARCIIEIINSTAYNNGAGSGTFGIKLSDDAYSEHMAHLVTNCLSHGNAYGNVNLTAYTTCTTSSHLANNSANGSYTITSADFVSLDSTGMDGARTASGALPLRKFLRLADGSDLINTGTESGLPYSGASPDLGCFETLTYVKPQRESKILQQAGKVVKSFGKIIK